MAPPSDDCLADGRLGAAGTSQEMNASEVTMGESRATLHADSRRVAGSPATLLMAVRLIDGGGAMGEAGDNGARR